MSGTIVAGDINPLGQTSPQALLVNEMSELIAAIRAGVAYANVHTAASPRVSCAARSRLGAVGTATTTIEGRRGPEGE